MVEHAAVNRRVVGSSPTSGAIFLFSVSEPITLKKDANKREFAVVESGQVVLLS